jgi:predicted ATP-grasp superfamily ATP-dependent carboligase
MLTFSIYAFAASFVGMSLSEKLKSDARQLATNQAYVPIILPVDYCNGLAQLRSHGRRGIKSIGVSNQKDEIALKSRFCIPWVVANDWQENEKFLKDLLELGRTMQGKGFLSVSSEQFIDLAARFQDELARVFILPVNFKLIRPLKNKEIQTREARAAGLLVPPTVSIAQNTELSQVDLSALTFPVFVRALDKSKEFYAEWGLQGIVANTPLDLLNVLKRFSTYSLLLQNFIDDTDRSDFCVSGLVLQSGDVIMYSYSVVRQVRRFGSSSMGRSLPSIPSQREVKDFLKRIGYVGPFDILFMKPSGTTDYFFTEINLRFWKSHGLAQKCGLDLPSLQALDAQGHLKEDSYDLNYRAGVRWWLIFTDLYICWGAWRAGRLTWNDFRHSIGLPFTSGIGSWDDPLPEIYNFLSLRWKRPLKPREVISA